MDGHARRRRSTRHPAILGVASGPDTVGDVADITHLLPHLGIRHQQPSGLLEILQCARFVVDTPEGRIVG